jgi:PAS domain S-box-containing protein
MMLFDPTTFQFIDVNRAALAEYGYTREEFLALRVTDLKLADEIPGFLRNVRIEAVRPRQVRDIRHRRKDGSIFDVEVNTQDIELDGGFYRLAMVLDVSHQKRAIELKELTAEATRMLASSLDVRLTLGRLAEQLSRRLSVTAVFKLLEEDGVLAGIAPAGEDPRDPAEGDLLAREAARSRQEETGHGAWALPLLSRGSLLGVVVFFAEGARDGGALNAAERDALRAIALQASVAIENSQLYAAARRAVRARDEVLEVVSHDLKNPLGAIQLNVDILRKLSDCADERIQAPLQRSVQNIQKATVRSLKLITDLLDRTKIESGEIALDLREHDCGELLDELLTQFQAHAAERGVRLERGDLLVRSTVTCDRERIMQALGNLVGNAVKFTPSDRAIHIGVEERADEIVWVVADEGPGIDERDLTHIFDRYWQPKQSRGQGTGLGLAIARGIIEAHGGRIWAESCLGAGSRFCFTLPLRSAAQPSCPLRIRLGVASNERDSLG